MDATAETAIGTGGNVFQSGDRGVAQDTVGNQLRVLDQVGGVTDNRGHQHFVGRKLHILPDPPLVLLTISAMAGVTCAVMAAWSVHAEPSQATQQRR